MTRPISPQLRTVYREVADKIEPTNPEQAAILRAKAAAGTRDAEHGPTGIERSQPREREPGED